MAFARDRVVHGLTAQVCVCLQCGARDRADADLCGGGCRFSSSCTKFNAVASSTPEVSFVITGLGGAGTMAGNATAMLGKVLRQHALVKARTERGFDSSSQDLEIQRYQMALHGGQGEDLLLSQRRASFAEGTNGLGPEVMLRRWGLIQMGEHISEKTLSVLSVLVCNARRHRSDRQLHPLELVRCACVSSLLL